MAASVTGVRSVEFGVANLDESVRFYEDAWGLSIVERNGSAYLRTTGPEHHAVVLHVGKVVANDTASTVAADDNLRQYYLGLVE